MKGLTMLYNISMHVSLFKSLDSLKGGSLTTNNIKTAVLTDFDLHIV